MKNVIEATEEFKMYLEAELPRGEKRWERLAYLVKCNNGFEVYSWGYITHIDGHTSGLEQNEALELLFSRGYMDGVEEWGNINAYDIFYEYFQEYLERFKPEEEEEI